jgi:hypothetical protein
MPGTRSSRAVPWRGCGSCSSNRPPQGEQENTQGTLHLSY